MEAKERFPGVFELERRIATRSLAPGTSVYGERRVRIEKQEYRIWDPFRSKLAAALQKGLRFFPFAPGQRILYLGASTGTTASHLSDIVGPEGAVYAVEVSPHAMNRLLRLCQQRSNIFPILADARMPGNYPEIESPDRVYQDVSQPDQADILLKNIEAFPSLNAGCLAVKSQSIDVTRKPSLVFQETTDRLETGGLKIVERYALEPFDKDHLFVAFRKRSLD